MGRLTLTDRLLSMAALRVIHRQLADIGYLVGQPVAIGARTLFEDRIPARLDGLFSALERSAAGASAAAAE